MTCQARESMAVTIAAKQLIAELKETSEASAGKTNRRIGVAIRYPYLWLVGNGRMVAIVVIIVPHSSIPY